MTENFCDTFWTVKQIAEKEQEKGEVVAQRTVQKWVKMGIFPNACQIENRWFIPKSDYDPATFQRPPMGYPSQKRAQKPDDQDN